MTLVANICFGAIAVSITVFIVGFIAFFLYAIYKLIKD